MKRILCATLLISLFLSGCQFLGNRMKAPVTFYYLRSDYQEDLTSVIASEEREASGHLEELSYLMALYLMGPISEQLESPLPAGTQIFVKENTSKQVLLHLSDTEKTMNDMEFTLACTCLSYTCLELTGTRQVTITSGDRSITMTWDNLILMDHSRIETTEDQP